VATSTRVGCGNFLPDKRVRYLIRGRLKEHGAHRRRAPPGDQFVRETENIVRENLDLTHCFLLQEFTEAFQEVCAEGLRRTIVGSALFVAHTSCTVTYAWVPV